MLGLRYQVGGDEPRVGGVVGQDADLGRAGLGVDADDAAQQPLGRRDVDVARPHHQVGGPTVAGAVGEHRDRLGAADRMDLVDAEQGAGREHDRVRQAAVVPLRRAGDRERPDAGDLGGDDVHDDAGRIGHQAARHVEPDPADRHPLLGDPCRRGRPRRRRAAGAAPRARCEPAEPPPRGRRAPRGRARRARPTGRRPAPGSSRRRRRRGDGSTPGPRRPPAAGRPRRWAAPRRGPPRRRGRPAAARPGRRRRARRPAGRLGRSRCRVYERRAVARRVVQHPGGLGPAAVSSCHAFGGSSTGRAPARLGGLRASLPRRCRPATPEVAARQAAPACLGGPRASLPRPCRPATPEVAARQAAPRCTRGPRAPISTPVALPPGRWQRDRLP